MSYSIQSAISSNLVNVFFPQAQVLRQIQKKLMSQSLRRPVLQKELRYRAYVKAFSSLSARLPSNPLIIIEKQRGVPFASTKEIPWCGVSPGKESCR